MDMEQTPPPGKYAATVKVGPKGQVVILLLADANQGIALMRQETLDQIVMQATPGHQSPRGLRGDEG